MSEQPTDHSHDPDEATGTGTDEKPDNNSTAEDVGYGTVPDAVQTAPIEDESKEKALEEHGPDAGPKE